MRHILLLFLLWHVTNMNAQQISNLLEVSAVEDANLSNDEMAVKAKIEDFPSATDIKVVQINDVKSLQENGYIGFTFQDGDSLYTFHAFALEVQVQSPTAYTWIGEIPDYEGGLIVNKDETGISGYLHFKDQQFEMFPLRSDLSFIYEHEPFCEDGSDPNNPPPIDDVSSSSNDDFEVPPCEGTGAGLTKVLILLDQYAQDALDGTNVKLFLSTQISLMNYAFANSNISHRVTFDFADFFWDDSRRNGTPNNDEVTKLSIDASSLRESYKADLVMLISDYDYAANGFRGYAGRIDFENYGYSIARLDFITSENIFLHELGHSFRAQHQYPNYRGGKDNSNDCDHAWSIRPRLNTIMHGDAGFFAGNYLRRAFYFSNPDVYVGSNPTGNIRVDATGIPNNYNAKNAAAISAVGSTVSGLRGNNIEYAALIHGSNWLCNNPEEYVVKTTPPDAEADYEWYVTYDGFSVENDRGTPVGGNNSSILIPQGIAEECSFFFLHVVVKYEDGETVAEASKRIVGSCFTTACPYDPTDIVNR